MSVGPLANHSAPRRPRWYAPTPGKFLLAVLLLQVVLFLSAQYRWFWFNERKGYTVLITVAATVLLLSMLCGWIAIGRLFRARAQFSLATLLLMVPVMAIPCAWFGRERELARQQDAFHVHLLLETKHKPFSDNPYDSYHRAESRSSLDRQLRKWLGHAFFSDFYYVRLVEGTDRDVKVLGLHTKMKQLSLDDCDITGDGIDHLNRLQGVPEVSVRHDAMTDARLGSWNGLNLRLSLDLSRTAVTDGGLEVLHEGLKRLNRLDLSETSVTDAGLENLNGLPELERLWLSDTSITDRGLVHLEGLTNLKHLSLHGTRVTDAGLKHLAGLTKLESLYLSGTQVTQAGFAHLQGLTKLQRLELDESNVSDLGPLARHLSRAPLHQLSLTRTPITDAGLEPIKGLAQLEFLCLSRTGITDAGLPHLQDLKLLTRLELNETLITDVGVKSLEQHVRLKHLDADDTQVTTEAIGRFNAAMSHRPRDRF